MISIGKELVTKIMKSKKILIILLLVILVLFYVSNIKSIYTIDDMAYVIALGLDNGDNNDLELTLQIALHSSNDSKGSSSSQSSSTITSTVNCNSISEGINCINSYIGKKLNLSYCKVIVISEDLAQNGINNYISTLINDIEVRPYCDVLVSKCDTKYFLQNSEPYLEKLSSKYYENTEISEKITGFTQEISLLDFYNDYYDTFIEPVAILGDQNSFSKDNDGKTEKLGLAVFHNGNIVGELSYNETLWHLMISNKFKNTVLTIPSPFSDSDYISLQVSSVKTRKKVSIINGTPFINCDISVSTRILSATMNSNYMTKENIKKIEEFANSYLKSNITDYLYKTSLVLKSDIDSFGAVAVKKFVTQESWDNYNWLDNYSSSFFNVNVNTRLRSSYLVLGI